MKTLLNVIAVAVFTAALSAVSLAQDPTPEPKPDLAELFEKFKKEGPKASNCGNRGAALETGKIILKHYENDVDNKPVIDFVKTRMALIEKDDPECRRNNAYDEAFKAKNWLGFMNAGKAIIAANGADAPVSLDVLLDMISVGFDRSAIDKNEQFASETVANSKIALQKCQAGSPSKTGQYGVFLPFKTKEDCVSWMYRIQMHFADRSGQKKESMGYLFKSVQGGENKSDFRLFSTLGGYYFDEAVKLFESYDKDRKANNNVETDELKTRLGTARAFADRGIDAYGRAYKIVSADASNAQAKAGILKTLTTLYKFRFNLPDTQKTPELEGYVMSQISKPMPDPMTEVVPVIEAPKTEPTTPTTTGTTPAAKPTTTPTTTPMTKPATTPAKPSTSTTTTKQTSTVTKTAPKTTAAKKPAPAKKGTR